MTVRISVSVEDCGQVVALHGLLDAQLEEATTDGLLAVGDCEALVIDLRDAVLASPAAFAHFVDRLSRHLKPDTVSIVCDRLSGRRLVRTHCPTGSVPVLTDLPRAPASEAIGTRA